MIQVQIDWVANPFRGDKFAEGWLPAAEAARLRSPHTVTLFDFGATEWSFVRAHDGRLDFIQTAIFPSKAHFERYWYSERIAEIRIELSGTYQVPIVPAFWERLGAGHAAQLEPR